MLKLQEKKKEFRALSGLEENSQARLDDLRMLFNRP